MPIVKFTLNDHYYNLLKEMAEKDNKSIQDYVRNCIFHEDTIFTVQEAINRVHSGRIKGKENAFTLPDIYEEEWKNISRGPAGVLGKAFFSYISTHRECGITFKDMGPYGRRAVYTYERRDK